jgi:hypothetical protein
MTGLNQPCFGASRGRVLLLSAFLLVSAFVVVMLAAATFVGRPLAVSIIDCTARAQGVAADV